MSCRWEEETRKRQGLTSCQWKDETTKREGLTSSRVNGKNKRHEDEERDRVILARSVVTQVSKKEIDPQDVTLTNHAL